MRVRIRIRGAVQGVGFRPHVYRLAQGHELSGSVLNSIQGVYIEAQGPAECVAAFIAHLRSNPPAHALVTSFEVEPIAERPGTGFAVVSSEADGEPAAFLLPDLAICDACRDEIHDPSNRRYRYAFTTCTHCGPRYSIVEGIPYDRPLTAMRHFPLCALCAAEYRDPADRRFHAQTNCCPQCGPRLQLLDSSGRPLAEADAALLAAAEAIASGRILALKGIGGFHLLCDATRSEVIDELRRRKRRPAKPFAVMAAEWPVPPDVEALLRSAQAPIVLTPHHGRLPDAVAPGNPLVGLMRPYSPLHTLLLDALRTPVIATSGNLSDEPICIDNAEALGRLGGIADLFLVHDRPIVRPVDDSVVAFIDSQAVVVRRARGYAPLPVAAACDLPEMIATGAHMKNTVAFSRGRLVFVSQHLGDLSTATALESHRHALADLRRTYDIRPSAVACDAHPDYASTRSAQALELPLVPVQHHAAHLFSAVLEHGLKPPVLGIVWDGSGFGPDGTVWGGEWLLWEGAALRRVAHLRPFVLPGGEQAVREPRRSLLGVLHEMGCAERARPLFSATEWGVLESMLARGLNCPRTTSAGRLFDAVAALLGLRDRCSFEGQAAMELEFAAAQSDCPDSIPFDCDWQPLVEHLLAGGPLAARARLFHNSLVESMLGVAQRAAVEQIALSGGCFQNALLSRLARERLSAAGFRVFCHRALPPNDGAIAAGQILAAALEVRECV